jgi:hypothetical protein
MHAALARRRRGITITICNLTCFACAVSARTHALAGSAIRRRSLCTLGGQALPKYFEGVYEFADGNVVAVLTVPLPHRLLVEEPAAELELCKHRVLRHVQPCLQIAQVMSALQACLAGQPRERKNCTHSSVYESYYDV